MEGGAREGAGVPAARALAGCVRGVQDGVLMLVIVLSLLVLAVFAWVCFTDGV